MVLGEPVALEPEVFGQLNFVENLIEVLAEWRVRVRVVHRQQVDVEAHGSRVSLAEGRRKANSCRFAFRISTLHAIARPYASRADATDGRRRAW